MGLLAKMTDPALSHLSMEDPTATGTPTPDETTDIAQMYLEWAASNPGATVEQAFAAGADIALGTNTPIGLGQVDEFEELSPFDQVVDIEDQVDTFPELQPQVDTFGEGTINKGSWRDTVVDVSDVQPGGPQG
tara:strand:+ start:76 stop:474 length:399 start_codon:yes stop_codon:yes gene_type:complete